MEIACIDWLTGGDQLEAGLTWLMQEWHPTNLSVTSIYASTSLLYGDTNGALEVQWYSDPIAFYFSASNTSSGCWRVSFSPGSTSKCFPSLIHQQYFNSPVKYSPNLSHDTSSQLCDPIKVFQLLVNYDIRVRHTSSQIWAENRPHHFPSCTYCLYQQTTMRGRGRTGMNLALSSNILFSM